MIFLGKEAHSRSVTTAYIFRDIAIAFCNHPGLIAVLSLMVWSRRIELRCLPLQGSVLPTELRPRNGSTPRNRTWRFLLNRETRSPCSVGWNTLYKTYGWGCRNRTYVNGFRVRRNAILLIPNNLMVGIRGAAPRTDGSKPSVILFHHIPIGGGTGNCNPGPKASSKLDFHASQSHCTQGQD